MIPLAVSGTPLAGSGTEPVGRWAMLWRKALLIRAVEERLLQLFAQGKLFGTVHTCIGQEWTGVAVAEHLRDGDTIFSNHRCHGHFLARTGDVAGLVAEIMGKQTGVCGGRGGSQHLCARGFFSNGIQGGILPCAAGLALAHKLQARGSISAVFMGDGTLGEGVVYETFNLASKWDLPLLIVLENNLYAQSTRQTQTLAGDIDARAAAFGIATRAADTWNPQKLLAEAEQAVALVRRESRPCFLRVDTYRLAAHSKGDDDRDPAEVAAYRQRDALNRLQAAHPAFAAGALAEINAQIDAALAAAEQAPLAAMPGSEDRSRPAPWRPMQTARPERVVTLIRDALERELARDPRVLLLGEDVESPYGGAFKATRGLSQTFPGRVRNTPISEALLVGLANGLALAGMRPVCEIMFGDFLTLACDQWINHASKFHSMYNGKVSVPLVVRTPMGGRRGYGPTHSQSLEKHFLGVPGTRMLALHHRHDPGDVYDRLFRLIAEPTLVIENKVLYAHRMTAEVPPGFALEHSDEPFPTTRIRPHGAPDLTVVCYGEMLREVEQAILEAFDEHEVICEVLCPLQVWPLNAAPIVDSVAVCGRLLVVEEGVGVAGFGAEVVAQVVERLKGAPRRVRRLAAPAEAIPACAPLERAMLPGAAAILRAILEAVCDE